MDEPSMQDDIQLLQAYVHRGDERALGGFVRRHLGLVHAACLRQCGGDHHLAEEAAQEVFCLVARKARLLAEHPRLEGWLFLCARRVSMRLIRRETARRIRETRAHAEVLVQQADASAPADWKQVQPLVDEALASLGERDRGLLLQRYFEGKTHAEIGRAFGLREDAVRMRVGRALEALRKRLARRGVASSVAALGLALESGALATEVSPALASKIGAAAVAAGVAKPGGAALLLEMLFMTKTQMAALGVVALLLASGTGFFWRQDTRYTQEIEAEKIRAVLLEQKVRVAQRRTSASPEEIVGEPNDKMSKLEEIQRFLGRYSEEECYAALFRRLKLTPAQMDEFRDLRAERAALQFRQGKWLYEAKITLSHIQREQLFATDNDRLEQQMQALLGPGKYALYREFEDTLLLRRTTELSFKGMAMTGEALDDVQHQRLLSLLKDRDPEFQKGGIYRGHSISEMVITEAAGFLSPTQVSRLREISATGTAYRYIREKNMEAALAGKLKLTSMSAAAFAKYREGKAESK